MHPSQIAFSKDSQKIAFGSSGGDDAKTIVISSKTGKMLARFKSSVPNAISFSPDGAMLAIESDVVNPKTKALFEVVQVYRISDGTVLARYAHTSRFVEWSPEGRMIAFSGENSDLHLSDPFDPASGEKIIHLRGRVEGISFSPDGSHLAAVNANYLSVFKIGR